MVNKDNQHLYDVASTHEDLEDLFHKVAANCKEAGFERVGAYLNEISKHHSRLAKLHNAHAEGLASGRKASQSGLGKRAFTDGDMGSCGL
jgi:hypothetical protein